MEKAVALDLLKGCMQGFFCQLSSWSEQEANITISLAN